MAFLSPGISAAPSRATHGIGCVVLGMAFFVGQDMLMKSLLLSYPIWMLMAVRSAIAVMVLVPLIAILGGPHRLTTPLWRLHALRAALFATGFTLFYTAFPFMGLAEVTTIFFSAPLMIGLMAAVFLKEKIGAHRIGALAVGFAGVIVAMNPTGEAFSWVSILPLLCAGFYAASQVLARRIGEHESSLTVGLYTIVFTGAILLAMGWLLNATVGFGPDFPHLRWAFPDRAFSDAPILALMGAFGTAGYILLSRAYQVAEASVIAPFDYVYLPMVAVMGWLVWREVPAPTTLLGMALIVASGLYLARRELRAARGSGEAALVAEALTLPGTPSVPPGEGPDGPS